MNLLDDNEFAFLAHECVHRIEKLRAIYNMAVKMKLHGVATRAFRLTEDAEASFRKLEERVL